MVKLIFNYPNFTTGPTWRRWTEEHARHRQQDQWTRRNNIKTSSANS